MASNLTRWDPFREMVTLRDAMDSLFENALIRPFGGTENYNMGAFPIDLWENEDTYVVRASLPGVGPDDLDVSVTDNVLTIKGELKGNEQKEGSRYHVRERRWGTFQRQVALPTGVDANKVQADYQHGILTLTLPKVEEAKPKRIAIRSNGQKMIEGQSRQS